MELLVAGRLETVKFWKALLIEEELVDRSIYYFEPWHSQPNIAIPVGKYRRTGYCQVHNEEFREEVMRKMRMMPLSFPDLRLSERTGKYGGKRSEVEWGDDISDLWTRHKAANAMDGDVHRLLGRAFGYKEERILALYPEGWPNDKEDSHDAYVEKYLR